MFILHRLTLYVLKCQDASLVHKKLEAKGILIRSFGNAPILGNCVRISVGSKEQNDILLKELAECLK